MLFNWRCSRPETLPCMLQHRDWDSSLALSFNHFQSGTSNSAPNTTLSVSWWRDRSNIMAPGVDSYSRHSPEKLKVLILDTSPCLSLWLSSGSLSTEPSWAYCVWFTTHPHKNNILMCLKFYGQSSYIPNNFSFVWSVLNSILLFMLGTQHSIFRVYS